MVWSRDLNTDFTLKHCLFGGVKLAKNTDPDKYVYTGYGFGFDLRSVSWLPDGNMRKNVIIFGADMSSSVHNDNKKKGILILSEEPTKELYGTTLTAEPKCPINFIQSGKICSKSIL